MKIIAIFTLIFFIIFNESKGQIPLPKLNACQRRSGATPNDIIVVRKKEIPTTTTGKCYLACVFEESGLMKNGRYNEPGAYAVAQRAYRRNPRKIPVAKRILNACKSQVSRLQDKCQVASRLAVCTTQMSERFKL